MKCYSRQELDKLNSECLDLPSQTCKDPGLARLLRLDSRDSSPHRTPCASRQASEHLPGSQVGRDIPKSTNDQRPPGFGSYNNRQSREDWGRQSSWPSHSTSAASAPGSWRRADVHAPADMPHRNSVDRAADSLSTSWQDGPSAFNSGPFEEVGASEWEMPDTGDDFNFSAAALQDDFEAARQEARRGWAADESVAQGRPPYEDEEDYLHKLLAEAHNSPDGAAASIEPIADDDDPCAEDAVAPTPSENSWSSAATRPPSGALSRHCAPSLSPPTSAPSMLSDSLARHSLCSPERADLPLFNRTSSPAIPWAQDLDGTIWSQPGDSRGQQPGDRGDAASVLSRVQDIWNQPETPPQYHGHEHMQRTTSGVGNQSGSQQLAASPVQRTLSEDLPGHSNARQQASSGSSGGESHCMQHQRQLLQHQQAAPLPYAREDKSDPESAMAILKELLQGGNSANKSAASAKLSAFMSGASAAPCNVTAHHGVHRQHPQLQASSFLMQQPQQHQQPHSAASGGPNAGAQNLRSALLAINEQMQQQGGAGVAASEQAGVRRSSMGAPLGTGAVGQAPNIALRRGAGFQGAGSGGTSKARNSSSVGVSAQHSPSATGYAHAINAASLQHVNGGQGSNHVAASKLQQLTAVLQASNQSNVETHMHSQLLQQQQAQQLQQQHVNMAQGVQSAQDALRQRIMQMPGAAGSAYASHQPPTSGAILQHFQQPHHAMHTPGAHAYGYQQQQAAQHYSQPQQQHQQHSAHSLQNYAAYSTPASATDWNAHLRRPTHQHRHAAQVHQLSQVHQQLHAPQPPGYSTAHQNRYSLPPTHSPHAVHTSHHNAALSGYAGVVGGKPLGTPALQPLHAAQYSMPGRTNGADLQMTGQPRPQPPRSSLSAESGNQQMNMLSMLLESAAQYPQGRR